MKRKYLKIAKELGFTIISYKSYWSDMMCRCVDIHLEIEGKEINNDWGYWDYEKEWALETFKKELIAFKTKHGL